MKSYLKSLLIKILNYNVHKQFIGAHLDNVVLGPELNKNFEVRCPSNLYIGYRTTLNGDCFLNATGGIKIGKYCHIAKGLTVYSHNHNWRSVTYIPYDADIVQKPVSIGDCVWIGCNVTIAPGATIGKGVIISSGSVVFGTIPDCAIIRGNPAVIIGYRNIDIFNDLYSQDKCL